MECLGFKQAQLITGLQEMDVPLMSCVKRKKILPWLLVITLECHVQSKPGLSILLPITVTYRVHTNRSTSWGCGGCEDFQG